MLCIRKILQYCLYQNFTILCIHSILQYCVFVFCDVTNVTTQQHCKQQMVLSKQYDVLPEDGV